MGIDDPTSLAPLCDEDVFAKIVDGMVADCAPRLFAIVEEYGVRLDGRIAAWGIEFDGRVEVVGVDGGLSMSAGSAEDAIRAFTFRNHITPRLVWVNPDCATVED
jgi:hypothetical protein